MRELKCEDTGLIFYGAKIDKIGNIVRNDYKCVKELKKELNCWKSDNIANFVSGDKKLGDFLESITGYDDIYYCFDSGKFASAIVVKGKRNFVYSYYNFSQYVKECKVNNLLGYPYKNYMLAEMALRALENNNDENNALINYIVVAPECKGRGIGTRIIKSINKYSEFFSEAEKDNVIQAMVHDDNTASQKIFERNGYSKMMDFCSTGMSTYQDYYYVK